jgi:His/Glu/Gln/Arg/opine family amino acid ABC transporter permease subunit
MGEYLNDMRDWYPLFIQGLGVTVGVSIATMTPSTALGFLLALLRNLSATGLLRILSALIRCYMDLFRGLPIIVTLSSFNLACPRSGSRSAATRSSLAQYRRRSR